MQGAWYSRLISIWTNQQTKDSGDHDHIFFYKKSTNLYVSHAYTHISHSLHSKLIIRVCLDHSWIIII